jgi:hypothetical protein
MKPAPTCDDPEHARMKVDPNNPIGQYAEYVLCQAGAVVIHDGERTPREALGTAGSAFERFCRSLDPNRCFIIALIPDDADRDVFFTAREVCRGIGPHMQAPVDTPDHHNAQWSNYLAAKRAADAVQNGGASDTADHTTA